MSNTIQMVIYPKQEDAYHDAVARKDWCAAQLFYMPPIFKSWEQIQSEMRWKEMVDAFEYEMKRIDEMDPELLRIETELRFGIKIPKIKTRKPTFFERIFSWL